MNRPHRFGIGRLLLRSTLCSALFFASPVLAQAPSWQLAMKDAELRDVVQHMSSVLGATVVLDPRVQGRITVISDQPLDREGVRNLFYSVLEAQGFAVVDQGERLLIIPAADAKTRASTAGTRPALDEEFVTEIIELNTSVAADLSGLLRPLVSNNGYVGPSTSANALVVTDTAANTQRIVQLARQLDAGGQFGHSVIELRHGLASDIAAVIEKTIDKKNAGGGQVIADSSSNRLVVIGTESVRMRLNTLAHSLDKPATIKQENARVIRLRHSDAKQLAEVLAAVGQGVQDTAPLGGATAAVSKRERWWRPTSARTRWSSWRTRRRCGPWKPSSNSSISRARRS